MSNILIDLYKSVFSYATSLVKISIYASIIFGIIIVSLYYIYNPQLPWNDTTIELEHNNFSFTLPATTTKIEIYFQIPPLKIQYGLIPFTKDKSDIFSSDSTEVKFPSSNSKQINILTITPDHNLYKNIAFQEYKVSLRYASQSPKPSINKIFIDDKPVDNLFFYKNNITSNTTRFVDKNFIRKDISLFLYNNNDNYSNYVLTFLTALIAPLTLYLLMFIWHYHGNHKHFDKYILNGTKYCDISETETLTSLKHRFSVIYSKRASNLRFLQALGPAIGFALTVSSLISSLNPAALNNEDLSGFFFSIQIAMISTFIGLLIRILALISQKYNSMILDRADERFTMLENKFNPA